MGEDPVESPLGLIAYGLLMAHRLLRLCGAISGISEGPLKTDSVLQAQAIRRFRRRFADIFDIPEENLKVRILLHKISLKVQKAELNYRAFQNLHLPLSVTGGLVEDVRIVVRWAETGRKHSGDYETSRGRFGRIFGTNQRKK